MADLEQFGTRFPDARSMILTSFNFFLTNTENRTKKSDITLTLLLWVKVLLLPKSTDFCKINAGIN